MDLETKLDEDFVFYLGFVNPFLKRLREEEVKRKAEQWLQKLCGEPYKGVELKRARNIYLSQLLICMQCGTMSQVFAQHPRDVDISNAEQVFELDALNIEKPSWLNDNEHELETPSRPKKGRTYVATRTLPDGQGAFAYIGVSLDDDDAMWLGGGEGVFDRHMEEKYREQVPEFEMEKILARRKDPKEREKVVTFYNILLQNIADELDEKIPAMENETINGLLEQLSDDMKDRGQFRDLEDLDEVHQRIELMLILYDRIKTRVDKVAKREEILDDIEKSVLSRSIFETSVQEQDRMKLPAAMWEQAINKAPNKKNIDKLRDNYPLSLIEKFFELLSNHKEEIAMRMQRRHENIIAQMKKDLRREDEKGKKSLEEAQKAYDNAMVIFKAVKDAYDKKKDIEQKNKEKLEIPQSEHSKLYDQMRAALLDTQKSVEDEAARGRALAMELNVVTEQAEISMKVNDEMLMKAEKANMEIMKNIKRLNIAINHHQDRIRQIHEQVAAGRHTRSDFMEI